MKISGRIPAGGILLICLVFISLESVLDEVAKESPEANRLADLRGLSQNFKMQEILQMLQNLQG